jgi:hypothetical protein
VSCGKGPPAETYPQDHRAAFVFELTANTWQPADIPKRSADVCFEGYSGSIFAAQLLPKINMELWFRALETRRGQKQLICKSRPPG